MIEANIEKLTEAVTAALTCGDWAQVEDWISQNSSFSYNFGPTHGYQSVPESLLNFILRLTTHEDFLQAPHSHKLLLVLEYEWSLLSYDQKDEILIAIEPCFNRLKDWGSWFFIAELLGQYYCNRQALEVIKRLMQCSEDGPRAALPMALSYMANLSTDEKLKSDARAQLALMRKDSSKRVRDEADHYFEVAG